MLDGGRRYLFHLRRDLTWTDGVPITAHDFEYARKRILYSANHSGRAESFFVVKNAREYHQGVMDQDSVGVHLCGKLTLEIELEIPYNTFLNLLSQHRKCPVPCHILEVHGAAWMVPEFWVTNGPFMFTAWESGKSIILEANPAYHGNFTGNMQKG